MRAAVGHAGKHDGRANRETGATLFKLAWDVPLIVNHDDAGIKRFACEHDIGSPWSMRIDSAGTGLRNSRCDVLDLLAAEQTVLTRMRVQTTYRNAWVGNPHALCRGRRGTDGFEHAPLGDLSNRLAQ